MPVKWVTHPSTNQARCKITLLICISANNYLSFTAGAWWFVGGQLSD